MTWETEASAKQKSPKEVPSRKKEQVLPGDSPVAISQTVSQSVGDSVSPSVNE